MLIARLFLALPLVCPRCGADRRIVAFITKAAPVQRILNHIGEPAEPPRIATARRPPAWDDPPVDAIPDWGPWRDRHPSTSSTRKCRGSPLPLPVRPGDAPLPAPRPRQTASHTPSAPSGGDLIPVLPVGSPCGACHAHPSDAASRPAPAACAVGLPILQKDDFDQAKMTKGLLFRKDSLTQISNCYSKT